MIKKHYKNISKQIEVHRFKLLLAATILVLILAATTTVGILGDVLFITSMSFLLIQSIIVSTTKRSKYIGLRYSAVLILIIFFWLEPAGLNTPTFEGIRLLLFSIFLGFITFFMIKFIYKEDQVDVNVIITAINIYLLFGLIAGSLAYFLFFIDPGAYHFPDFITEPKFNHFIYYSYVTMSTLGYGDITPVLPSTQTLAYFIAIVGQLYVAIIIAILVGKMIASEGDGNNKK